MIEFDLDSGPSGSQWKASGPDRSLFDVGTYRLDEILLSPPRLSDDLQMIVKALLDPKVTEKPEIDDDDEWVRDGDEWERVGK